VLSPFLEGWRSLSLFTLTRVHDVLAFTLSLSLFGSNCTMACRTGRGGLALTHSHTLAHTLTLIHPCMTRRGVLVLTLSTFSLTRLQDEAQRVGAHYLY